ncbi:MAG: chlorite dismutase family protein [Gemmatimonadaceae bacterium]|nr:chlorite dismutase family protein [Gemmatimonadaceae bacterium]MDQ3519501.1 chlorite dismutase family protein [Gemmatimonadota bacterium]
MSEVSTEPIAAKSRFVQYIAFKIDPLWRRLPRNVRETGRGEFAEAIAVMEPDVSTAAYSTLGLKTNADLMLWWKSGSAEPVQEGLGALLQTGLGQYCEPTYTLFGLTRPSVYTKTRTNQEQAINEPDRLKYLVVYPFSKTIEWYLMSQEARQGLMNEHMRVGRAYLDVRQVLLYTTGLDDQEFIVAYETDSLERHQQLVIDLRSTEARRYTLRDTPIITGIYRPLERALELLG